MAERGVDLKEEKKSYGSVFVIGVALLVALSLWAYWDDNITRRPWKGVQARFYRLDYGKAKAAYDEEDKKLQDDPKNGHPPAAGRSVPAAVTPRGRTVRFNKPPRTAPGVVRTRSATVTFESFS